MMGAAVPALGLCQDCKVANASCTVRNGAVIQRYCHPCCDMALLDLVQHNDTIRISRPAPHTYEVEP